MQKVGRSSIMESELQMSHMQKIPLLWYSKTLIKGGTGKVHADLVIAANGANSMIRRTVLPDQDLQRPYSGY